MELPGDGAERGPEPNGTKTQQGPKAFGYLNLWGTHSNSGPEPVGDLNPMHWEPEPTENWNLVGN